MKKLLSLTALLAPSAALAQTQVITDANSLTQKLIGLGNIAIYLLISLAILYIIWNIVQFLIKGSDDETARSKARGGILWGIVGLAVILSIWGLVNILTNTFRTTPTNQPIPSLGNGLNNNNIPGAGVPQVQ